MVSMFHNHVLLFCQVTSLCCFIMNECQFLQETVASHATSKVVLDCSIFKEWLTRVTAEDTIVPLHLLNELHKQRVLSTTN